MSYAANVALVACLPWSRTGTPASVRAATVAGATMRV